MKRHEAVTCLKEITSGCSGLSPDSIALFHSNDNDASVGYQLHIKTVLDDETNTRLEEIADKHKLGLKRENDKVIIYKPKEIIAST